jgi:hypothetical protein
MAYKISVIKIRKESSAAKCMTVFLTTLQQSPKHILFSNYSFSIISSGSSWIEIDTLEVLSSA